MGSVSINISARWSAEVARQSSKTSHLASRLSTALRKSTSRQMQSVHSLGRPILWRPQRSERIACQIWGRLAISGDICAKCGTIHCGVTKLSPVVWKGLPSVAGFWMVAQHGGSSRFGVRRNLGDFSTNKSKVARVGCIMRDFPILLAWGRALASSSKHDEASKPPHVAAARSQDIQRAVENH
jgi:hypothetical protein